MDRFIQRENIKHYRQLLEQTTDEIERQRIMTLLAQEEAKMLPEPPEKKSAR